MSEEKVTCEIASITFFNGTSLELKEGDIVVFTGPNNAGKTQCLRDIETICRGTQTARTLLVQDIKITKHNADRLHDYLQKQGFVHDNCMGEDEYHILGDHEEVRAVEAFKNTTRLGGAFKFFVSKLNTASRLSLCEEKVEKPREQGIYLSPMQCVVHDKLFRNKLSDIFFKAFGQHLVPDNIEDKSTTLCIGEPVMTSGRVVEMSEELNYFRQQLSSLPRVVSQGDGVKSFIGIVMELMMEIYSIFTIDEPEAFLHPPHARVLGREMVSLLSPHRQLFLATHSSDLIKGLLETGHDRVKIVRIDRSGDKADVNVLKKETFDEIWNDPILRHSNIMDGLFHKKVVICESDSDCKFYSVLLSHISEKEGRYPEILFVHSGSKQRLYVLVEALKKLNVDTKVVPDIDILNQTENIRILFESCGGNWNQGIADAHKMIALSMPTQPEFHTRQEIKEQLNAILDKSADDDVRKEDLDKMSKVLKQKSKWSAFKEGGINTLQGDALNSLLFLLGEFAKVGLHPVPCGQLESFIPSITLHGPKWVNAVLENYPDLDDPVYDNAKTFIRSFV